MLPHAAVSVPVPRLSVDIRTVPWVKRLAADYAYAFERVADLFSGNPGERSAWSAAISRTQRHPRSRDAVVRIVQAQQERRGAPAAARAAAARIGDAESVAVVTGQQAGLFGGPLFTLLKAVTALRTAEAVRAQHGIPVVAVFWIDAEDHDWDEVRACGVLDRETQVQSIDVGEPAGAHALPVARVRLDGSVEAALAQLESVLPPTEYTGGLLADLRDVYRRGAGMSDAFARWIERLLGPRGLVVYDAGDSAAKPLLADLFARELAHPGEAARLAADAGDDLTARGYHAQVTPQPGAVALFHLNAGRDPIRRTGAGFQIGNRIEPAETVLQHARTHPEAFSPNVLLRPLAQDTLFPTVAYVAGPNEIGYLAQLAGVYRAHGMPMPLIQPRLSATLLDSNAMRFLIRQEVPLTALQARDESTLNALLQSQLPPAIDAAMHDARAALEERLHVLADAVKPLDATLEGAVTSALGRMQDDLKKLQGKIIQAAKRRNDTLRRQFQHAQAQAFPRGHLQEREIGFISFLNRSGPALVDRLMEEPPLDPGTHWVIGV